MEPPEGSLLSSSLASRLASSWFGLFCSRLTVMTLELDVRCSRCPRAPHLSLIGPCIAHDTVDEVVLTPMAVYVAGKSLNLCIGDRRGKWSNIATAPALLRVPRGSVGRRSEAIRRFNTSEKSPAIVNTRQAVTSCAVTAPRPAAHAAWWPARTRRRARGAAARCRRRPRSSRRKARAWA
jgi:hypothetical protein